jgi:hypothetical protein
MLLYPSLTSSLVNIFALLRSCHGRVYLFLFFCVEVLIIRYDKMVSHMMPTCALYSSSKARDPGKDLPYHSLDMCTL